MRKLSLLQTTSRKSIWVQFQREGIHRYPAAAEDPNLEDVSFLAHPHRHIFHFRVDIEVFHDDRELEFIQVKRWLESLYSDDVLDLDFKSCEMIAEELLSELKQRFGGERNYKVSVAEDNENGAIVEFEVGSVDV